MSMYKVAFAMVLIAMALMIAHANAGDFYSTQCSRSGCTTVFGSVNAEPHIIKVPKSNDAEREARIAQWEAYCQPRVEVGAFGVERYTYAREGCEFGKRSD